NRDGFSSLDCEMNILQDRKRPIAGLNRFTHTHGLQDWGRFMHNSHCEPFV
ncbi:MAG: hypothetical protein RLZZ145_841, partial [Pseudomonadota bacterium]